MITTDTNHSSANPPPSRGFTAARAPVFAAATTVAAVLALAACNSSADAGSADGGWQESAEAAETGLSPVLLLGDSVAAGQAIPLGQALSESGVRFTDGTSTGGGNVVGPNAEAQWADLPERLLEAEGGVVVYQLTTYDWGTESEQREAYERLAEQASDVDADMLFLTMPPIEPDEFYEPHMGELGQAAEMAQSVAEDTEGVEYLDAATVWGTEFSREHNGEVDRSSDGIHTCPQGAARFTSWILNEFARLYPGFTPAEAVRWANEGWSSDEAFVGC